MRKLFFSLLLIIGLPIFSEASFQSFSQNNFYKGLASNDTVRINEQLHLIQKSKTLANTAYEGTLMMKKSSFLNSNKNKISMFNQGKELLEKAIKSESNNGEFRFLRLTIQENCPPAVKYNSNKKEDSKLIKQEFQKFSSELKNAVIDYSKKSKILKPSDFPN